MWMFWFVHISDARDNKHLQTPLHMSCFYYVNLDVVRYLIEKAHCDISTYLLAKFVRLSHCRMQILISSSNPQMSETRTIKLHYTSAVVPVGVLST